MFSVFFFPSLSKFNFLSLLKAFVPLIKTVFEIEENNFWNRKKKFF